MKSLHYIIEMIFWTKWKEQRLKVDQAKAIENYNESIACGDIKSADMWFIKSLDILDEVFVTIR